jgi:tetratricopeptide (TPR) repeat protein
LLKREAHLVLRQVWDTYYPIGEEKDLPFSLGQLLATMSSYAEALDCFEHSLWLHGPAGTTFYNMAVCQYGMGQRDGAARRLRQALELDPDMELARALLLQISEDTDDEGTPRVFAKEEPVEPPAGEVTGAAC